MFVFGKKGLVSLSNSKFKIGKTQYLQLPLEQDGHSIAQIGRVLRADTAGHTFRNLDTLRLQTTQRYP